MSFFFLVPIINLKNNCKNALERVTLLKIMIILSIGNWKVELKHVYREANQTTVFMTKLGDGTLE